ncbi:hypothetical protein I4U23_007376 [Adineta vaga]|nr:hypothetical protein I4U23_007376 [Adineta vaga]
MVENTLIVFCLSYILIFIIYLISLRISQYYNVPYFFYLISIVCSYGAIFIPTFLELQSTVFVDNVSMNFFIGGLSILFTMKFFELAFSYPWIYIRQIPASFVVMYIISFPQMAETKEKFSSLSSPTRRQENIRSISRGICQLIILQILRYLISPVWLALPSSSLSLFARYIRYGLFSIFLYLTIDTISGIGFGIYGLVFDISMKSVFPAFPFTSTSLREFWSRRWNRLIQTSLHLLSFIAIPSLLNPLISFNNTIKGFLAFTISGLIHEYVLWFVTGKWSGQYMIFFWIHGVLVFLEVTLKFPIKPNTSSGKFFGWLWTIGITWITSPLFFDPVIDRNHISNVELT